MIIQKAKELHSKVRKASLSKAVYCRKACRGNSDMSYQVKRDEALKTYYFWVDTMNRIIGAGEKAKR